MAGGLRTSPVTKVIEYIIYLQIMIICACARNITLTDPQSSIIAQIGEELRITCLGTKCQTPNFIWSSLADSPLRGETNNIGQISVLTMKISSENLDPYDPYRCTVRCDNPPAEKGFKVIVYSLPKPILTISSLMAGEQSQITCTIPDAYPFYMVTARIWIGEKIVTEYDNPEIEDENYIMKNITLTHDLILIDKYNTQKIKCEAEVHFQEDGIDPISQNTLMDLELLSPPEKPKLTIYPTTRVQAGQRATIECLANDSKNVNVTLWKVLSNGDTLLLEEKGEKIIKEAAPIDAAVYKCIAENHYGVSEASESLTVLYPPMETYLTSSDEEVNEGGEVTLTCSSKGVPEPSFVFYHLLPAGYRVRLSEGPVFTLTNVTSGIYQCLVMNVLGSKTEELELRVRFPPRNTFLTITPSSVTREGESLHISCTSDANPAPTLVLKKETKTGLIELEAENGQYSITNVTEEHAGIYKCESSNVVGQQEAKATVTVQVPPKNTHITITPSAEVREGEFIDIRCVSEGTPAPRLSLKVRTEHGVRELVSESGQYQIAHADMKHSGTYICESTNILGQQQLETTLTILVPPKNTVLTINPSPVLTEGRSGHIICTSEAFPAPKLVLKKRTEAGPIELTVESGIYSIEHVGVEDEGIYICESTNEAGQQISETTLTVQASPKNTFIVITPSSVVKEGNDVQIQCVSEAYPSPMLVLLMKTEHGLIKELESEDGLYNITNAGEKNMGTYICESINVVGQQTAEAILTVEIPSRNTTVVAPSQNITAGVTVTVTYDTHIIPPPERQKSSRFDYVPPAIIGSVVLVTAGFIGIIAYHLKQARVQGSYSLVKALRSTV